MATKKTPQRKFECFAMQHQNNIPGHHQVIARNNVCVAHKATERSVCRRDTSIMNSRCHKSIRSKPRSCSSPNNKKGPPPGFAACHPACRAQGRRNAQTFQARADGDRGNKRKPLRRAASVRMGFRFESMENAPWPILPPSHRCEFGMTENRNRKQTRNQMRATSGTAADQSGGGSDGL